MKIVNNKPLNNIRTVFSIVVSAIIASVLFQPVIAESSTVAEESVMESPVILLERTSEQVIKILRDDHELLVNEPDRIYKIIDDYILPHLDEVTMAKLALGKNWKKATKQQKREFVNECKQLLVRTYSTS